MNTSEYISSGILELYALDMLSEAEKREVWLFVQEYSDLAEELERIELSLEKMAQQHQLEPEKKLRGQIFTQLNTSNQKEEAKVLPKETEKNRIVQFIAIAASLLLLISISYNIYLQGEVSAKRKQLSNLKREQSIISDQSQQFKTKLKAAEEKINLFQNPDIQNVLINGTENSPGSYAYISYNKKDNSIRINGVNLPKEGDNNSYQLWALVDGVPVDLGIFNSSDGLVRIEKSVENVGAFAVTLETKGGNPTPNLEKLYLIGNV